VLRPDFALGTPENSLFEPTFSAIKKEKQLGKRGAKKERNKERTKERKKEERTTGRQTM
jgi:hypothetical protein